jgi:hypothetical protein
VITLNNEILGTFILSFVIVLVISILLFMAFREVLCWYWKINDTVKNLSEINDKLSTIINKMDKVEEDKNKEIKLEDKKIDSKGTYA